MKKYDVCFHDLFCLDSEQEVKKTIDNILKNSGINYKILEIEKFNEIDEEPYFSSTILIKNVTAETPEHAIRTVQNVLMDYFNLPDKESGFFYIDLRTIEN